ncbi:DUF3199 family protein [Geomicrobium sp. JCM 19039]|uniref:protein YqbG n=1 Tax=Geomicrobium sp. JCM 19039 TaxID=1460636 RepID=UPI00045F2501|nr:DUF3199 family protein [Geomicrobium sp. JCM 19039]GAK11393.1 YqbG protein [Geomicrobium sp. JCM 19039]
MVISAEDVKHYSTFSSVKKRSDELIELDIVEAVVAVEAVLGKEVSTFDELPSKIRIALLKMAQFYALINGDESIVKGYQSEKISDYSYSLASGGTIRKPEIFGLLEGYIDEAPVVEGTTRLRMRSL